MAKSGRRVPVRDKSPIKVLRHILRQIEHDQNELALLTPELDWVSRIKRTAEVFVPRIAASSGELLQHVERSLNSPEITRAIWDKIRVVLTDGRVAELFEFDVEELVATMNAALES